MRRAPADQHPLPVIEYRGRRHVDTFRIIGIHKRIKLTAETQSHCMFSLKNFSAFLASLW
jgi:hypothetical protein